MKKIPAALFARDILALRSVCQEGLGRVSELILTGDRRSCDPRRVRTLMEALARYFAVDLVALRQRCSLLLHGRNFLPLPFSRDVVMVPLTLGQCGEKTGYVNLPAVLEVAPWGSFSKVTMAGGTTLECWLSEASVRNRLLRAQLALRELGAGGLLAGLETERRWRRKLEIIRAVLEE